MSTSTATVSACAATQCAFNDNGCTALAITVSGDQSARCATFSTIDVRAGLNDASTQVGACHRVECVHNDGLLCSASEISMEGDTANCASYQAQ